MKKRIVICCDGTWQRLESGCPTNTVRLAKAVLPLDPRDGTVQIVHHLDGVGSGRGTGWLSRLSDRVFGGLLGRGLAETVVEAYRFLVFAYRPGDEIYLFGFSRGAYTARSLAGMIRNCGILSREHADRIRDAFVLYRATEPGSKPDGECSLAFRADFAPHTLTGDGERAWRERNRPGRDWSEAIPLRLCYLGVWDTVGALGVPEGLTVSGLLNRRHRFHDTRLSSRVQAARHAVAIDERRRAFEPTLWNNVDALNGTDQADPDAPYQQRWFPGVHGAVGGNGDDRRLANGGLLWVAEGAERQGLVLDADTKAEIAATADPLGPLSASTKRPVIDPRALLRLKPIDRDGPEAPHQLSREARIRWSRDADYRPRPLRKLRQHLDA